MDVVIRSRTDSDVKELDKLREEEEISKLFSWGEGSLRASDCRRSLDERYGFAILVNGECAGYIALEAPTPCRSTYSLLYMVGREYRNKGVCTEALKQIVRYGFETLKIHKICGDSGSDNPASGRVMEKVGFKREG